MSARIDAHHHLWQYTEEDFGWLTGDLAPLRRDYSASDLQTEMHIAKVDGAVAVQARQSVEETDWLLQQVEESAGIVGVVGWLPIAEKEFGKQLEHYAGNALLKGLRHIVQAEASGFLDGEGFNEGIRSMQDSGLVYDVLIYERQMEEAIRFVDRHPQQMFVLDHVGKPDIRNGSMDQWRSSMFELGARPHVACKISGMVTEADPKRWTAQQLQPYFDVALQAFGADRLMIGTDWPVLTAGCTYAHWWQTVEGWTANLSVGERNAILGGTAQTVYRLQVVEGRDAD